MKKGLILEGGAMRGLFTAGVMDVMMENDIRYDGAIGVSAGAAFGCNYKSHQIGRVLRYNKRFCADNRYCGMRSLLRTGNIYSADFCYHEVPLNIDIFDFKTYREDPMEFYLVCTDVETGKPVYCKYTGKDSKNFDWIRASSSMPLVSQIVEINGRKYLDGGISDSIPLRYFEHIGYEKNVVVLTQPKDYRKKKNRMMPLIRKKYKDYPNLIQTMAGRHVMYNREVAYVEKQEAEGNAFVIRPPKAIPVSRVEKDPEKLQIAYDMGREAARNVITELKQFLDGK